MQVTHLLFSSYSAQSAILVWQVLPSLVSFPEAHSSHAVLPEFGTFEFSQTAHNGVAAVEVESYVLQSVMAVPHSSVDPHLRSLYLLNMLNILMILLKEMLGNIL